jgi:cyclophilin family peptidyl-prolyl cis-trans isomerase/HEAT repeat protein
MPSRLLVNVVLAAAAAAAVAGAAQAQRPSLSASDVSLYAQLLAMTDTRQLDTALVDRLLASNSRPLRAAAALAIGQIGAEQGAPGAATLRRLLNDPDANVAAKAAYALGLLRDLIAVAPLTSSLSGRVDVAREAAWALGEIGAPARNAIVSALRSTHDDGTTIQLLLAAAKLRPVPVTEVRPYLRAPNPSVVWAATYAVARQRAPSGLRDLITLARSPAAREQRARAVTSSNAPYVRAANNGGLIRAEVARALTKSATGDSLGGDALALLRSLASDTDPHVRINALRSLGTYGQQARATIANGTRDRDPNVRIAAAQSLASALTGTTTDFEMLWARDTAIAYRASLLASAARAGIRPPQLSQWTKSADWHLRGAVAAAEGDSLDRSFALARTLPLINDPDPRVREAAYGAIAPPASMMLEDSVHVVLIRGLQDPDFYVRATALAALTERPSARDLPAVIESYRFAARDSANDARLAALQYIAATWKKDSAAVGEPMRAELARETPPADPLERAAGKDLPFWKSWASVRATARPASWYQNVVRTMVVPSLNARRPRATIETVRGPIRLELFGEDAPITAFNFLSLARSGYYRSTRFHRVVPNFVAQDGDPRDDGNGGPGYSIRDEMNPHRYERGAVGMALSGPDTGGSQYFITHSPQPHLDGHYTVFGRVIGGFDVLDRIVQGDLITRVDPQ